MLNEEIKQDIVNNKRNIWKEKTCNDNWNHKLNTQQYWSTMKTLQGKKQTITTNRSINFNNKISTTDKQIADSFNKLYTGIAPKITTPARRKTMRKLKKLPKEDTIITAEEVKKVIKEAPTKKSSGPDKVSMIHIKHLGEKAIQCMANLFTIVINRNIIPEIWKTARIVPILKPKKDKNQGKSYRPISLISNLAKLMERIVLHRIQPHLPNMPFQHGYKKKFSTVTALQKITGTIADGFNQKRPPKRTIVVAIDMSRAFDVIDRQKLIDKMMNLTAR